jgi:hypothetical protein
MSYIPNFVILVNKAEPTHFIYKIRYNRWIHDFIFDGSNSGLRESSKGEILNWIWKSRLLLWVFEIVK